MTKAKARKKASWIGPTLDEVLEEKMKNPQFARAYAERRLILETAVLLRSLREKAELSQAALAKRAGLKQAFIARLESAKAKTMPSLTTLSRIAAAAGQPLRLESGPLVVELGRS